MEILAIKDSYTKEEMVMRTVDIFNMLSKIAKTNTYIVVDTEARVVHSYQKNLFFKDTLTETQTYDEVISSTNDALMLDGM